MGEAKRVKSQAQGWVKTQLEKSSEDTLNR